MKNIRYLYFLILCSFFFLQSCENRKAKHRAFVVSKIKSASKLSTVEYVITKIIIGNKEKRLLKFINLKESVFLAHTQARVKAGINLNKIKEKNIKIEDRLINVVLPPVEIINFSYPAEKFQVDEEYTENAFLNNITIKDMDEFYRLGEMSIRKNINRLGIKEAAEQKTRVFMRTVLQQLGFNEIYINFEKSNKPLLFEEINEKAIEKSEEKVFVN